MRPLTGVSTRILSLKGSLLTHQSTLTKCFCQSHPSSPPFQAYKNNSIKLSRPFWHHNLVCHKIKHFLTHFCGKLLLNTSPHCDMDVVWLPLHVYISEEGKQSWVTTDDAEFALHPTYIKKIFLNYVFSDFTECLVAIETHKHCRFLTPWLAQFY